MKPRRHMPNEDAPVGPLDPSPDDADATVHLLARARAGDQEALERLFARYGPELRRFAHGRLPAWARDIADTLDLVQETLLQVFKHIDRFEHRGEGALRAYMRQALMNRIRNELRRSVRRPAAEPVVEEAHDEGPSPLEEAIGRQLEERYDAALASLRPEDRELVVARVELGLSYAEIAAATARTSANAARMAVVRALMRLTEEMDDEEKGG
jgi:RNA polymerase sigma factor (sigma-70 family)